MWLRKIRISHNGSYRFERQLLPYVRSKCHQLKCLSNEESRRVQALHMSKRTHGSTSSMSSSVQRINSTHHHNNNIAAEIHCKYNIPDDEQRWVATPLEPVTLNTKGKVMESKHYSFPTNHIRNVSVVAHVDHGKTTLTDALLRKAELLSATAPTSTFTDRLQVEKERGITIKAQTCSLVVTRNNSHDKEEVKINEKEKLQNQAIANSRGGIDDGGDDDGNKKDDQLPSERYLINLIDTPGHVDFQYEVSRSLHASDGVLLLIDVRQGLQAQTMAHFNEAIEQGLEIIPVFTKMDLVMSDDEVSQTLRALEDNTGLLEREVLFTSAMAKQGIEQIFDTIITRIPPPKGCAGVSDWSQLPLMHRESELWRKASESMVPLRALLFDCWTTTTSGINLSNKDNNNNVQGNGNCRNEPVWSSKLGKQSSNNNKNNIQSSFTQSTNYAAFPSMRVTAMNVKDEEAVYCLVRILDGTVSANTTVTFFHSKHHFTVLEVGLLHPSLFPLPSLTAGMVGYVLLKNVQRRDLMIGDTIVTLPTEKFVLAEHNYNEKNMLLKEHQEKEKKEEEKEEITHKSKMEVPLSEEHYTSIETHSHDNKSNTPSTTEEEHTSTSTRKVRNKCKQIIYPVPGFKRVQPVVFADFYPDENDMVEQLTRAVELLIINDPAVTVESISCPALGQGLQLGFLGLLHLQVFQERLLNEFRYAVLVTPPQVRYKYIDRTDLANFTSAITVGTVTAIGEGVNNMYNTNDVVQQMIKENKLLRDCTIHTWKWPHEGAAVYLEPYVHAVVVTPQEFFQEINRIALQLFRGNQEDCKTIDHAGSSALLCATYTMPLADLARGFFNLVKSISHGYASLTYDDVTYNVADLVKVEIMINKACISALSMICPRQDASATARRVLQSLKENLSRSIIDLPLQAMVGQKIIARETIKAYSKDVTAKIHAGDISRKMKKWSDQKKGKEKIARRSFGNVNIDQEILAAAMNATVFR